MKTNHTKEEHPKLANKPAVAYNDGDKTIFISWNEYRVEFAVWDRISEYPTYIYQLPLSSYSPTTNIKDEHSDVEATVQEFQDFFADAFQTSDLPSELEKACMTWLHKKLTSLQEQHEREKREVVEEIENIIDSALIDGEDQDELHEKLKTIAKKHNITL